MCKGSRVEYPKLTNAIQSQLIGYARVSSQDQNLEMQLSALKDAGVRSRFMYHEKISGKNAFDRPALQKMLSDIEPGDVVVVNHLDRLARSLADLITIVGHIKERGGQLRVLKQDFDTTSASGNMMWQILGVFSEFERSIREERQREGIAKAKERGVYKGRKPTIMPEDVLRFANEGMGAAEIAMQLGVSRQGIYRVAKEAGIMIGKARKGG
jgi:DNA invertase Pin-like site-specific DNA recombinase